MPIDAGPILEALHAYRRERLADSLIPDPDSVDRARSEVWNAALRAVDLADQPEDET